MRTVLLISGVGYQLAHFLSWNHSGPSALAAKKRRVLSSVYCNWDCATTLISKSLTRTRAFRELDNKRRLAANVAAEQSEELFHVVNVVGADGVLAVGVFVKLSSGDDHSIWMVGLRPERGRNLKSKIRNRKSKSAYSATVVAGSMMLTEVP
jgi:hypothetical protein